jgi:hypothetical protein
MTEVLAGGAWGADDERSTLVALPKTSDRIMILSAPVTGMKRIHAGANRIGPAGDGASELGPTPELFTLATRSFQFRRPVAG